MLIYNYFDNCAIVLNVRHLGFLPNIFYRQYVVRLRNISSESCMVDLVNIVLLHAILLFSMNFVIVPFFISAIMDFFSSLLVFQLHVLDHDCITLESKIVDFVLILLKLC